MAAFSQSDLERYSLLGNGMNGDSALWPRTPLFALLGRGLIRF